MQSRRHFLGTAGAGLAAPLLAQQGAAKRPSANDTIQVALIGAGGMGQGDASTATELGHKIVAVADIYDGRLTRAKELWGNDVVTTRDYREVLARKDVDAVIVATPDHWHHTISIDAMNAGKDVYCQKPMVQRVENGQAVVDTAKKTGRILQVGSQRASSIVYEKARQLIAAGAIGRVNMIEAWWDRNSSIGAWQYSIPTDASPETIDWERFLGRAPKRPFEPVRLFRWRNYRDYGTGVAGDLFVHLFTGLHYVMQSQGPSRVFASGGLRYWKDGRDVPDVLLGLYDYPATPKHPSFNLSLRVNFVSGQGEAQGFRFVGEDGILTLTHGVTVSKLPREAEPGYTIETFSKPVQEAFLKQYRAKYPQQRPNADSLRAQSEERYLPPPRYSDQVEHHRNFYTAVRTRKPVVEDAAFGFRAAGPALLSNVSYFENRICEWDPAAMKLKG